MSASPRRVVVITGASSGVGRAAARAFAARGDDVGIIARNGPALKQAAAEAEAKGARAYPFEADVADAAEIERAAEVIASELGPIDVWVNNAMISIYSPVAHLDPAEVARVTAVNYLGTVHGTLAALKHMIPRDEGTIVQVGSGLAYRAIPLQAPYCASKHAIRAFTESLRTELLHDRSHVRVTMVQLPGLNTPHFTVVRSRMPRGVRPAAPIFTPELAARAVLFAADHARREHLIGGVTTLLVLAQKIAPGLLDRFLARRGYESQLTNDLGPSLEDNMWEPPARDLGATGPFADEARDRSLQFWAHRLRTRIGSLQPPRR